MSLATPAKIRTLQRGLYRRAKTCPAYRFYTLYDKVYRLDILEHAYRLVKSNDGAPGVDGETFSMIEASGVSAWLVALQNDLRTRTYRPSAVRRVLIPKDGGGERKLGIPTIRDRVAQMATKLVLDPIFEADLDPNSYGYRPQRSAKDAIRHVHCLLRQGYTDVVDADLSQYFDTIPHRDLLRCVARRVSDSSILRLVKLWLKAPVDEGSAAGLHRLTGGQRAVCGTPQGGVISPLLANIYMNRLLKYWHRRSCGRRFCAEIICYADDFVILSRGHGADAFHWVQEVLPRLGLMLNEQKTAVRNAREEHFAFLGYSFGPYLFGRDGTRYLGASPSVKSLRRLKVRLRQILYRGRPDPWPDILTELNSVLRGWSEYFDHGTLWRPYQAIDRFVASRVRQFLVHRHKVPGRGTRRFPWATIFGELGVHRLIRSPSAGSSVVGSG